MPYYMVLNDGETYTGLDGCKIIKIDLDPDIIEKETDFDEVVAKTYWHGHTQYGEVVAEFNNISMIAGSCGTTVGFL